MCTLLPLMDMVIHPMVCTLRLRALTLHPVRLAFPAHGTQKKSNGFQIALVVVGLCDVRIKLGFPACRVVLHLLEGVVLGYVCVVFVGIIGLGL
jgi:hypothetical protein